MSYVSEKFWQRFSRSLAGRFFAAGIIAGCFGASAGAEIFGTGRAAVISFFGSAFMGILAVGLLEWRDRSRERSAEWQKRLARTSEQIRTLYPSLPPETADSAAKQYEVQRFTPLVWFGMALGGFSMRCGIIMFIIRVVEFIREL